MAWSQAHQDLARFVARCDGGLYRLERYVAMDPKRLSKKAKNFGLPRRYRATYQVLVDDRHAHAHALAHAFVGRRQARGSFEPSPDMLWRFKRTADGRVVRNAMMDVNRLEQLENDSKNSSRSLGRYERAQRGAVRLSEMKAK